MQVNFLGMTHKTQCKKKTLYPVYYETMVYDNVVIADYKEFMYASQVCVRLYDQDTLDSDDYLGKRLH
ncbi:hypothetical protein EON63_15250 [archaeon]|nr:MAG: hypothetical protein EON63_15250 [archaeon]